MNANGQKKAVKQCKELLITLGTKKRTRKRHSGATVLKRKKKKWDAVDAAAALSAQDNIANEAGDNNGVKSVIVSPLKVKKRRLQMGRHSSAKRVKVRLTKWMCRRYMVVV